MVNLFNISDSDQKLIIDHFQWLISIKTIDFFSIVEFQSSIYDNSFFELSIFFLIFHGEHGNLQLAKIKMKVGFVFCFVIYW